MKYNFIIPYRNRKEHLDEFIKRFSEILKDKDIDAQFYIIHQINSKEFNRGAMKNIGFLEISKKRPDGLFIFHDVDVFPVSWGLIKYETNRGYFRRPIYNGYDGNLGLVCSCWKEDFEKTNGFPNYWGWGVEDETLYKRALKNGIIIDENSMVYYKDEKNSASKLNFSLFIIGNKRCFTRKEISFDQFLIELNFKNFYFN
jgi:hypothetical protein